MRKNNPLPDLIASLKARSQSVLKQHGLSLVLIFIAFLFIQQYVFDENIDLNGDNALYYTLAQSIHNGSGYTLAFDPLGVKTNVFPPGYPFLMSLVLNISDGIYAQKVFNSILLLFTAFLIYFLVYSAVSNKTISLLAAVLPLSNFYILKFNIMMMSETSYIFFSVISFLVLYRMKYHEGFVDIIKDSSFILLILTTTYAFHIRTHGIALVLSVILFFLFLRKWIYAGTFTASFVLLSLPWILRNKLAGVGGSKYLSQALAANLWRPEEGTIGLGAFIARMFDTAKMLMTQAMADSIIPSLSMNYSQGPSALQWLVGLGLIFIIVFGLWKSFEKYSVVLVLYILGICGIIAAWSAPSQNRYMVVLIPILQVGLFLGLIELIYPFLKKNFEKIKKEYVAGVLLLCALPFYSTDIKKLYEKGRQTYPPAYRNYFSIGKTVKKNFPDGDVIVSCRKPELFYLFSNSFAVKYTSTKDDSLLITNFIRSDVDFVVLEQLGYSSTGLYLYPAIQKNPELFTSVIHLPQPDTWLLRFEKDKARAKFRYLASE